MLDFLDRHPLIHFTVVVLVGVPILFVGLVVFGVLAFVERALRRRP